MKFFATICMSLGMFCTQDAAAMILNPRGTGQVLVFPYYTVNKHQQTLIMVTNASAHAKALQVRFREGYNGRDVLEFQVFLPAHDAWTAALFALEDAGLAGSGAAILVDDKSCTAPNIAVISPRLPDGRPYQPFLDFGYSGGNQDTGPTDDTRTREGYFEIYEMAEVTGDTLAAVTPVDGTPANCNALSGDVPSTDLAAPTGGLAGTEAIVNVAQGTFFGANAYAIDGFANHAIYYSTQSLHPDLSDATAGANGFVSAHVPVGDRYIQLDYPPAQSIDAVSALFMAAEIFTEWENSPAEGAQTDLVITFPTKHHYVDHLAGGTQRTDTPQPFDETFGAHIAGRSQAPYGDVTFDREGSALDRVVMFCPWECPVHAPAFAYETQVLTFSRTANTDASEVLGSKLALSAWQADAFVGAGTASIDVTTNGFVHQLRPDAHGVILRGLPLVGFTVINYINGKVVPGVLSNYSGTNALRTSLGCDSVVTIEGVSPLCGGN